MKNIKSKIKVLLFIAITFTLNVNALIINDTISLLEVKGKILKKDKAYGIYKVQLICNNVVEETKIVNDEKTFVFNIPNNKQYIIKVIKEGYADKVVYVNAGSLKSEHSKGAYRYEFVVNMESIGELSTPETILGATSVETKNINSAPEFNWKRKYCKKVTPLPY